MESIYKSDVALMTEVAFKTVLNIIRKGENAGYQLFVLLPRRFQSPFPMGRQKTRLFGEGLTVYHTKKFRLV